jgi:PAS domain S-box-containing protein
VQVTSAINGKPIAERALLSIKFGAMIKASSRLSWLNWFQMHGIWVIATIVLMIAGTVLWFLEQESNPFFAQLTQQLLLWLLIPSTLVLLFLSILISMQKWHLQSIKHKQNLQLNEQRLHLIMEAVCAGFWEWDLETNTNEWSKELWELYHLQAYTRNPSYETWRNSIHPDDWPMVEEKLQTALAHQDTFEAEWRVKRPDASKPERWLLGRGKPITNKQGKTKRYIGITIDITQRKQAEIREHENEKRYQHLFESSCDALMLINATTGDFVQANTATLNLFGAHTEIELANYSLWQLAPQQQPDGIFSRPAAQKMMAQALEQGSCFFEWQAQQINGELFFTDVLLTRIQIDEQQRLQATIRDITERKVMERALRDSERRFQDIAQVSDDWIWELNTDAVYSYASKNVQQLLGYRPQEMLGRSPFDFMPAEERQRSQPLFAANFAQHQPFFNFDKQVIHRDGSIRYIQTNGVPIFNHAQEFLGYRGIDRDVTEMRLAYLTVKKQQEKLEETVCIRTEELLAARLEAERLSQVKSEFLANMSHEIRTPLNAVLGLARIGKRTSHDQPSRLYFERILNSGTHLLGIINDILDFSKIEAGKLHIDPQPFQLAQLLEQIQSLLAPLALQKGLQWCIDHHEQSGMWFMGDAQRLQQILINLLSNAIKFTARGQVTLSVHHHGTKTCFTVKDTGIGIAPEHLACLFRPFEQADNSITRDYGGTGLGLAISYQLARLMDANLNVCSEPDEGTEFTLCLNLPQVTPLDETTAQQQPATTKRLLGMTILAAEDIEVNRLILEDALHQEGAEVVFAVNGQQALDELEHRGSDAFDAILMDIQMPEMDGYTATRHCRAKAPQLPVIGLTAHAFANEQIKCRNAGMVAHIAKPLDHEILVSTLLRHARRQQQLITHDETKTPGEPISDTAPEPSSDNRPTTAPIINWYALRQRFQGREAFINKLITAIQRDHQHTITRLETALADEDYAAIAFLAHGLKGLGGTLVANSLQDLAIATETAAREQHEITSLTQQLITELQSVLAELAQHQEP